MRTCDSGNPMADFAAAIKSRTSPYALPRTPISSSLTVELKRQGMAVPVIVPRSELEGFDYESGADTVFFNGTSYRPAPGDLVTVSFRAWGP